TGERTLSDASHHRLILDQQDRTAAPQFIFLGPFPAAGTNRSGFLAMDWQIDDKAGALVDLRIGEDEATRLFDDAVHGGKAKTGPLPYLLGSEERLEDLAQHARRDPRTRVGNRQRAVIGDRQNIGTELRNLVRLDRIGLDDERAAALGGHRVPRIDGEIDDDLFEL